LFLDHFTKKSPRRRSIADNRPDAADTLLSQMRANGSFPALMTALVFAVVVSGILMLRENVVRYRPQQWVGHDVTSRVDFVYSDKELLTRARQEAWLSQPRVYKADTEPFGALRDDLLTWPDRVADGDTDGLSDTFKSVLDAGAITALQQYRTPQRRPIWEDTVAMFVASLNARDRPIRIIPDESRKADLDRSIILPGGQKVFTQAETYSDRPSEELISRVNALAARNFELALHPKVAAYVIATLRPTHTLDDFATTEAKNNAADNIPSSASQVPMKRNMVLVPSGVVTEKHWQMLRAENEAYLEALDGRWQARAGVVGIAFLVTAGLSAYVAHIQPRIMRNPARAIAIGSLLVSMLLLTQLAAIGSSSLYLFGVVPTLLASMILAIAYDRRFAIGVASIQAILVVVALNQGIGFFVVLWSGILTACFLLDDIRTRSKLIEVGGVTMLVLIVATIAHGLLNYDPIEFIARNGLYAGAAGISAGFIVLGILPFIEKAFRMTTSMTLLELADASQPLLRRLAMEAPGTYSHSMQVASLAESAADAINANGLLCRVAAYYHDVGKINKADYFIENQTDGQNRHYNLNPSVSLLIIIGHVKDGVELAREYNLPTSLFPFIQQHHGTTLVEYFYHRAVLQGQSNDAQQVHETQYRYPGPKPKSKEIAILMLADAVESATRAMPEPNASRIEALVHDLSRKRLTDGQFDECDLNFRELELIERTLSKTLLGIYHGRIAYPSTASIQNPPASNTTIKSA